MKTAEQIFDAEFYFLRDFLNYKSTPVRLKAIVIDCMEKFAEQQKPIIEPKRPLRLFEKLDVLNQIDDQTGSANVGVCNTLVSVEKKGKNGHITIGVPGEVAEEISLSQLGLGAKSNKRLMLCIVNGDEYDKLK